MRVTRLILRDLRTYPSVQLDVGEGLTVIAGRNGAGKTNLLEGLYIGCTGRSFRTASDREAVPSARRWLAWSCTGGPRTGPTRPLWPWLRGSPATCESTAARCSG